MSEQGNHGYCRDTPKKQRERHNCCVPQCSEVKNDSNHLHIAPKDLKRRKLWAIAIKTGKTLTDTMHVCSKHFLPSDYFPTSGPNKKPKLKRTAIPSQHLPTRSYDKCDPSPVKRRKQARSDTAAKRCVWSTSSNAEASSEEGGEATSEQERTVENNNTEGAEDRWINVPELMDLATGDRKKLIEIGIQVGDDLSSLVSIITQTDKKLISATGTHSVALLESLTKCAEEIAPDNPCKKIHMSTKNRIVLTMMKTKLAISFSSLGVLFDLKRVQTCCNYFYDMVTILAKILKCMVFWPSKEEILMNMPKCCKGFGKTRVVLDCYEIPVGKPKCIVCRVKTYSH